MSVRCVVGMVLSKRYRLVRSIALGGMGEVFEAVDERSGLTVAIKVMKPECNDDREWCARFKREAEVAMSISSPHVARVLDFGRTHTGLRWIALEFFEGESLEQRLQREGIIPFFEAAWMGDQILLGIEAAHRMGVIHRDMKPANLFLVRERTPRLVVLDFGIAKRRRSGFATSALTSAGEVLGTPSYMSPEQFVDPKNVDLRTDLYSCGIIMYRMLTGRVPFEDPEIAELLNRKRHGDFALIAETTEVTWPDEVEGWVQHMAAALREDRFASAAAAARGWMHAVAAMRSYVHRPIVRSYRREETGLAPVTDFPRTVRP